MALRVNRLVSYLRLYEAFVKRVTFNLNMVSFLQETLFRRRGDIKAEYNTRYGQTALLRWRRQKLELYPEKIKITKNNAVSFALTYPRVQYERASSP